jgi:patatin-like phospholipase/acyl hydrolase
MKTMSTTGITDSGGQLTLSLAVGQPNTEFDAVVVVQLKTTTPKSDPWFAVNSFRQRLAASGRAFSESADLIREDRER